MEIGKWLVLKSKDWSPKKIVAIQWYHFQPSLVRWEGPFHDGSSSRLFYSSLIFLFNLSSSLSLFLSLIQKIQLDLILLFPTMEGLV
jgi:hypothetical protein